MEKSYEDLISYAVTAAQSHQLNKEYQHLM